MTENKKKKLVDIDPSKALSGRPDWDDYFMEIAEVVGKRSTCLKRKVGAILVKDKHILSTGYNGAPRGLKSCDQIGTCLREELGVPSGQRHELCRGLHAEQNAVIQAAFHGVKVEGATLYCNFLPCVICAKIIINAGIKRIVFKGYYPDDLSIQLLKESKIELTLFKDKKGSH